MIKMVFSCFLLFAVVSCGSDSEPDGLQMYWNGEAVIGVDDGTPINSKTQEYSGNLYKWEDGDWSAFKGDIDPQVLASVQDCPKDFTCSFDLKKGIDDFSYHDSLVEMLPQARLGDTVLYVRYLDHTPLIYFDFRDDGSKDYMLPGGGGGFEHELNDETLNLLKAESSCFESYGAEGLAGSSWNSENHEYTFNCDDDEVKIDFKDHLSKETLDQISSTEGFVDIWVLEKDSKPKNIDDLFGGLQASESHFWGINEELDLVQSTDGINWSEVDVPGTKELVDYKLAVGGYVAIKVCDDIEKEEDCSIFASTNNGKSWGKNISSTGFIASVGPSGTAVTERAIAEGKDTQDRYSAEITLYDFKNNKVGSEVISGDDSAYNHPDAVVDDKGMIIQYQKEMIIEGNSEWTHRYEHIPAS